MSVEESVFERYPSLFTVLAWKKWGMLKVSCILMETLVLFIKNIHSSFWWTQTPKGLCRVLASTGYNWSCCCSIPLGVSCCLSPWAKATWKCSFVREHARGKQRYLQRVRCCLPLMKRYMIWMVLLVFSKLDLNQGYHQLLLHPDSRHITKFSTPLIQVQVASFRHQRRCFKVPECNRLCH